VLLSPEVGLEIVTASFHYERIPQARQNGEYFYQGFKAAIESGAVQRFGHPLWELYQVYAWDPEKFQEIADLAKKEAISFEVSSNRVHQLYDERTAAVLEKLIENGNLIDFGTDFHNFSSWMKKSALVPETTAPQVTEEGRILMERWEKLPAEQEQFHEQFKQRSVIFGRSLYPRQ